MLVSQVSTTQPSSQYPQIIDATRISDGSLVIVKKIAKGSREKAVAQYMSSFDDQRNHCVPILDTFVDDADDDIEFLVMPVLRRFNDPPFRSVNEVVDFMRQTLEVGNPTTSHAIFLNIS